MFKIVFELNGKKYKVECESEVDAHYFVQKIWHIAEEARKLKDEIETNILAEMETVK